MSHLFPDLNRYLNRDLHSRSYAQNILYRSTRALPENDSPKNLSEQISETYTLNTHAPSYVLKWRQRKLIVQACLENPEVPFSSLDQQEWLIARLQNSPIKLVKLDLALGETCLQIWAEACHHTAKQAFLRLPGAPDRPQQKKPLRWWLKRRLDWMIAALLLMILSPALLAFLILLWLESPEPAILRQWCVGERGRLFQCFKFRTGKDSASLTDLGQWLSRLKLDRLPLLLNVLRGEMSLVGSHPLDLGRASQVNLESRCYLNWLPGIVGIQRTHKCLSVGDSKPLQQCDRKCLEGWSLRWDLKFLVMAIPKLIFTLSAD